MSDNDRRNRGALPAIAEDYADSVAMIGHERRRLPSMHSAISSLSKAAVFQFIEGWYNPHRLHSSLGYLSPVNYEREYHRIAASAG